MADFSLLNYDLLEKIGEGGICDVYKIRRLSDNTIFALKKLKSPTPENMHALETEYLFLAFHGHPGILGGYEYIKRGNLVAIVMDYLPGGTLEIECGKIPPEKLKSRMMEILEIANFVSHCGYNYNDYKPQNFVINSKGKLQLIDFNLVQKIADSANQKSGTFGYIAPELLTGNQASTRSDIYSLGATFYELASGRMPFEASDEGALIKLITENKPKSISTGNTQIDDIIMSMLEIDPQDRPGSFIQIACSLGEQDEFIDLVKAHKGSYLGSGLWPFVNDITAGLNPDNPGNMMIITGSDYESRFLLKDIISLMKVNYDKVIDCELDCLKPDLIDESKTTNSLLAANLSDIHKPDIAGVVDSIIYNSNLKLTALFTTSSPAYGEGGDKLSTISLRDIENRTDIYIEHYLGKYSLSDKLCKQLDELTGGDPELIEPYVRMLIDQGTLTYTDQGWEDFEELDTNNVPSSIADICNECFNKSNSNKAIILNLLSVLNRPQTLEVLAGISGQTNESLQSDLHELYQTGILVVNDDKYNIKGEARRLAFYRLLNDGIRREYHEKAFIYFRDISPDLDQQSYHSYYAGFYTEALELNFRVAGKYFEEFTLKSARKFIQLAEAAYCELSPETVDNNLAVNFFNLAGDIAKTLAEYNKAIVKYGRAAMLAKNTNDDKILAEVYKNLGDVYRMQQKPSESINYSNQALVIFKKYNDLPLQAACLNNLGLAHWTAGDHDNALEQFGLALKVNEELGDLTEQSKIHNNIAIIFDIKGQKEMALEGFRKALDCAVSIKNLQLETKFLDNIGYFFLNSGQPQESLEYFHKSYKLAMKIGFDDEQLNIVSNIAQAYYKMGDFIQSAEANQKALAIAESLNHQKFRMQASYLIARDCLALGNYRLYSEMIETAETIGADLSNPEMINDTRLLKLAYFFDTGQIKSAEKLLDYLGRDSALTYSQKAHLDYFRLKKAALSAAGIDELKQLSEKIIAVNLPEFSGQAILEYASALISDGNSAEAYSALNDYSVLNIEDTLIEFQFRLIYAKLLTAQNQFDQAIEQLSTLETESHEKGCIPMLFRALVNHASLFDKCRKESIMPSMLAQTGQVYSSLVESFPENIKDFGFNHIEEFKTFRFLADKYGSGIELKQESL